jgi:hypothetical protein
MFHQACLFIIRIDIIELPVMSNLTTAIERGANMPNGTNRKANDEVPRTTEFAHVIERIGLSMLGALCGLFVSALIVKANVQAIDSLEGLFATMLYGAIGFYLGIDFPSPPPRAIEATSLKVGIRSKANPLKLIGALGTLLAAMTAMVSVCLIILDSDPYRSCIVIIGGSWLFGVTMQLVAGSMARVRRRPAHLPC